MSYYDNMSVDLKACDTFGYLNSIPPHVPVEGVGPSVHRQAITKKTQTIRMLPVIIATRKVRHPVLHTI